MTLRLGAQTMNAEAGDAVIIAAETPLHYTPAGCDLLYDWVLFDDGSDRQFCQALQIPENTLLRFGDTGFLSVLLEQLCAEFYASNPKRSEMIDCLLKALLIRIAETGGPISTQQSAANKDPHYAELVRLREKIYANPQEKWTVEMLCSEVSMSRSYFQLIYRETFGMTCIADVINCKMNRARDLLTSTSYTISHIAQLCGYDNEEHFMRQFKKNNGVTPTVFRREHRA
jgi:AraC family transcriptional regulator of arabinose operon